MHSQFPAEQTESGEFERQADAFRDWLGPAEAEPGRYHLYVSLACPWASRALLARNLMGLQGAIGLTIADPVRDERGWALPSDAGAGFKYLAQAYEATQPGYQGRVTVPVLWDKQARRIVNNSEDDLCRMFNDSFRGCGHGRLDWFPAELAAEQAQLSALVYERVNNGVYRAGFATAQAAYEKACRLLFAALDELDRRLATRRYLFGERIVETDWRLFCTLVRFDAVYYVHFKCNLRRITDYPHLQRHLRELYGQPGVAATVNLDHIKRHYYLTHREINPTGLVPLGPQLDWLAPG